MAMKLLVVLLLLAGAPAATVAQDETGMDDYEEDDPPVLYQCDPTELLILYNRSDSEVRMHCSLPQVCGEERTCVTSTAPSCEAKSQYLSGVQEQEGGGIISSCCQITPAIDGEEPCYEIMINDQTVEGADGGLFNVPGPGGAKAGPSPPARFLKPGAAPRVAHAPAQPSPPAAAAPPAAAPSFNKPPGTPRTFQEKVDLMLFDLYDRRPPTDLVKGIYKSANGYRVKICTPQCRTTTTTTSTPSTTTASPTTRRVTNKPRQQNDEHGAAGGVVESDGRIIRTLSGDFCRTGGQIECQAQCRIVSGANFINAVCKPSSGASPTAPGTSQPGGNDGDGHGGNGGGGDGHGGGNGGHGGQGGQGGHGNEGGNNGGGSNGGNGNTGNGGTGDQQCVCTERKSTTTNNQQPDGVRPRGLLGGRAGGHGCFRGDMTAVTRNGPKRMDELHVGDEVLVLSAESDQKFQPIEWFYHRDPERVIEFVNLKTESGRVLSLTPNHLLPLFPCSSSRRFTTDEMDKLVAASTYFASRAKPGLCVASKMPDEDRFESDQIVEVTRHRGRGIYSPITNHGTLVVNGVQASCYSSLENHVVQRTVHSVLVKANRLARSIWKWTGAMEEKEIPPVLLFLLEVAKNVLPSHVYA